MRSRSAFTLFELILALALSATLLALIGTALNLYLLRMETGRTQVEEAQLARSLLATIATDVRAATTYQTQDISSVERLASSAAAFNVDDIDNAGAFTGGALGSSGGSGSGAGGAAGSASGQTQSSSSGLSADGTQATTSLVPGLNGLINELVIDVARLPRLDELFPAVPQQPMSATATATAASMTRPSDMKTVRYFMRQGTTIDPSDSAATGLAPAAQQGVGGLVRQTVDRAVRQMAEQAGNSRLLESGQVLLAPEVTQIQFRYFDGTTAVDVWDMQEREVMPTAVEVRIWLLPQDLTEEQAAKSSLATQARMYCQTIDLPLAQAAGTTASSSASVEESTEEESSEDETGGTGDTSGTGQDSGSGSGFGVGAPAS